MNPPTPASPLFLACTVCDGHHADECDTCHGTGPRAHRFERCPYAETAELEPFIEMAGFAEQGILPVAGGALDQSASFMDALRFYRRESGRLSSV